MGSRSEDDEFFPDWFGRRRGRRGSGSFFDQFFGGFADFDEVFERMFEEMARGMPRERMSEKKLPDGSTVRQYGPFVYGYSMSVGPDGKPVIQEFGNVKPSKRMGQFGVQRPALEPAESREPLVDVVNDKDTVRVVAELPGVAKADIKTTIAEDSLTISVDNGASKYYKEVKLPAHVDADSPKATYNNGVLEITLSKTKQEPKGKALKIE